MRCLLDDHLALRAVREQRLDKVSCGEGKVRTRVEPGHVRALETVFGTVSVERLAYRAPRVGEPASRRRGAEPAGRAPLARAADAVGAGEPERQLRRRQCKRSSGQTGVRLGKRQVEDLAVLAAIDVEDFYEARSTERSKPGDLLVISADGKGIVMRPDALRHAR